ncbi:anti-sigma factor [Pseudarthrobacter sp. J1763]|uniref:anti-sigma factor n=1 Tax=Pseudarthrobacter sp. J1763 TaxID=3420445 RepID=UPI003D26E43E
MEQQLHLLTGAYALNALSDTERKEFERHALANEDTQEEIRSLSQAAALLAYGAPAEAPPAELKATLMATIRNTPQLSASDVVPDLNTKRESVLRGDVRKGTTPSSRLSGAPRRRWVPGVAAAAALVVFGGAGVGGWVIGHNTGRPSADQQALEQRLASEQEQQASMLAIMGAQDAKVSTAKVGQGTLVTVATSGQVNRAGVMVKNMPAPPEGKAYELWFISDKGAVAAGLMKDSGSASSFQILDGSLDGATHIGITVEPAGGSVQPTTTPILLQPV